ncbi:MAG: 50S ribosomal protein L21 [Phycisphaerales bacterium]|nr:50S ribosomal protein L21 [Phycisphaerales bacterium]MCB9840222.1 50S ribosomal protein L21 [Phycisphaeraceae bacterium]
MYAIIEESGSQRRVAQGDSIYIDLLEQGQAKPGSSITFDRVLLVGEPGGKATVGTPYVKGASVTAEIVEPVVKGDKIVIYKHRPKKTYRVKQGHRQRYTQVKITGIKA